MMLNTFAFICEKCSNAILFKEIDNGCLGCGHHLFRVAWNHGLPGAFSPDTESPNYDPYRRKSKPGDGKGPKLTIPGNEESGPGGEPGAAALGPNVRSLLDPRATGDASMHGEEYRDEVERSHRDIEDMEETNLDVRKPGGPDDLGPKPGTFDDPGDPLGYDPFAEKPEEPKGPHNMHNVVGPHNQSEDFDRLTDDIFDQVRSRHRRRK